MNIISRIGLLFGFCITWVKVRHETLREFDRRVKDLKEELVHDATVSDEELEDRYLKGVEAIRFEVTQRAKERLEEKLKRNT